MITRFNYVKPQTRDSSHDDEFKTYEYKTRIKVLSTHKDGSVDKYIEESYFEEESSSWSDYINSFNLGSVSEQVMNHLSKGTPLVTAHVLPSADYTKLEKGAEIKREMTEKGISFDMIVKAVQEAMEKKASPQPVSQGE